MHALIQSPPKERTFAHSFGFIKLSSYLNRGRLVAALMTNQYRTRFANFILGLFFQEGIRVFTGALL
jgi:hypothetical protein